MKNEMGNKLRRKLQKKLQKTLAKTTALTMAAALMTTSIAPVNVADAKTKGPKLSKKSIRVVVKKTKKVKLKNTSLVKKTKWSIKNKKIAKLTKKKKTSIVIRGKKAGKTTVTAKVTLKGKKKPVKLTLKVQVVKNTKTTQKPSNTPRALSSEAPGRTSQPTLSPSSNPNVTKPPVSNIFAIDVPGNRTGIKQGETLALTASGADSVSWSVTEDAGATIDATGHLTVSKAAEVGTELTVTAQAAGEPTKNATKKLTVVENQTAVLTDRHIRLNQTSEQNLTGLTFRSDKAYSTVSDPERGNVTRFDASKGYTSNSYDMLAWVTVDPAWAGKTVTLSGYLKYEASEDITGNMNLVLNENWGHSNPANKYNAEPDTWYYVTGTFTLPEYRANRYDGSTNRLYIARDSDTAHLPAGKNAVYYIDDLVFSVEKADIENVTISTAGDATEIYQNHDLQCSATVSGTGAPSQKVTYSIEPAVAGATIDENGLLQVGNVPANTKITVKAAAYEDESKYATKEITVLPQTITSVSVSAEKINPNETNPTAEENPTEIYAGEQVTFKEAVVATGEPDTSVIWSVSPATAGVTLTAGGVLTVTEAVPDNTALTVKATSKFDASKFDEYAITVKKNKISKVTVNSAGNKTTVSNGLPLSLSAKIEKSGIPSEEIVWTIVNPTDGVSLASLSGKSNTLSVTADVAAGTSITVRATSVFDSTQYGEITVTVESESSDEFDFNRCTVEYWEDFSETSTVDALTGAGVVSWQATVPDNGLWGTVSVSSEILSGGVHIMDDTLSTKKKRTPGMNAVFGNNEDYLQFTLSNGSTEDKTYTLSFMFRFVSIAIDGDYSIPSVDYELPLKMIMLDENNSETILKENIQVPYRCDLTNTLYNKEFYEINNSVNVPAGKTVRLQLKLDGALPTCQVPDKHTGAENEPHPIVYMIDNIAISNSNVNTISMKSGENYQLNLDTVEGDEVTYYTNSYLAKYTHEDMETTCDRFDTTVADVDATGKITANKAGETALIAEIKRSDGTVERKQCIVEVK